jgi:hypothetical protein
MPPRDSASGAGNRHLGAGHEPGGTSAKLNIETREMDQLSKIKFSAKVKSDRLKSFAQKISS